MTSRIILAGGPRTGKTTRAAELARTERIPTVLHTDDLIHLGWSEASLAASYWFDEARPWIVEGVAAGRALRKWLERNPEGRPADRIVWFDKPYEVLTDGQETMRKGCVTVWQEILPELVKRGVELQA